LRKYETSSSLEEEDLDNIIKFYDRNVDGAWTFKEFITSTTPLLQYSVKAKDLHAVKIIDQVTEIIPKTDMFNKENYGY
jgi:hypothetical protein